MLREGRAGLLFLSVCALSLLNATAPLNPTVKVVKHPAAALPPECDEGVAPAPSPRIQVAEAPPEPMPVAAHPETVRDLLQETQAAAARGDREGFNDALARLKAMPDHAMANDVIRVYDDLNRLWTYEFETPTGAFFDSSNELLPMLSAYPAYRKSIAEQTLTAGGAMLYPSRESRDFLVREAASRLAKLGLAKKPAAPPVAAAKPTPKPPREKPRTTITEETAHKPQSHHARTKKSHGGQAPTPVPRVAEKKPAPRPTPVPAPVPATTTHAPVPAPIRTPTPTPVPTTTTHAPAPAPAPVPVTTTHAPAPAPAPASVPTTTTQAPVPAPAPVTTTTTAPATDTTPVTTTTATPETTTTATETTASEAPQAQQAQKSPMKNVILPIILIVIGIGVLIVLFRASS